MKNNITTQPYKGARDFYPDDMLLRNYIFNTWKKVCKLYGYEEYDFPILEPFEIFAAKSGEELVSEQLFTLEDKSGRKLAIRPEITPGTVRMIAKKYKELPRPIRWFTIGNNWRFEKPQTGRGREFYQLEVNIFGVESVLADFEIFNIIIELMLSFGANEDMFELRYSDRKLVSALLNDFLALSSDLQLKTRRIMDKKLKISEKDFAAELEKLGLKSNEITAIEDFLNSSFKELNTVIPQNILSKNEGYKYISLLENLLEQNNISKYCLFSPSIIRGFDYSDGLVYEVFDKNPGNKRSMFGGERFDKLINIFGNYQLPATGFAMGDITLAGFLKNRLLIPNFEESTEYLVTVWPGNNPLFLRFSLEYAKKLRQAKKSCIVWTDTQTKLDKQLKFADRMNIKYSVIFGEDELKNNKVIIKNMFTNTQSEESI